MKSKTIEIYYDVAQVLDRIDQLKKLDYEEDDMYIIVNNSEDYDIEELEEITDVKVKDEETTLDVLKNLITGEESLLDIFDDLNLDEEDRAFYYKSLENGDILLYVDREYVEGEIESELYPDEIYKDIVEDEDLEYEITEDEIVEDEIIYDDEDIF